MADSAMQSTGRNALIAVAVALGLIVLLTLLYAFMAICRDSFERRGDSDFLGVGQRNRNI